MSPGRKKKQEGDSILELLRLKKTTLTQDEFCSKCGIPRTTYQRWVRGDGPARPTIPQLKAIAEILGIEKIKELPDDFGRQNSADSQRSPSNEADRPSS